MSAECVIEAPNSPWVVVKFGGTSVSTHECWEQIAKTIRERLSDGYRPLVVCSAVSQVSNQLEQAIATALTGENPIEIIGSLIEKHTALANELGCQLPRNVEELMERVAEQLAAIASTKEASPRLRAEILSVGELSSTLLGSVWLEAQGISNRWLDARTLLEADVIHPDDPHRQHLSATCSLNGKPELEAELAEYPEPVFITQGFVVRAPDGGTAVLGRGGSDTSATYFGQRLSAARVEIWTDVPGLFTADPRLVPDAKRLRRIGYDEVIELATRGAKILHPRSLVPARASKIPIEVRSTHDPTTPGTIIHDDFRIDEPAGLAISSRKGMAVVTMDVELSWQEVGIIANLSACFARHGLSIDSLASSQTRVTVSLDPTANLIEEPLMHSLLNELREYSAPVVVSPVASVSIVGTHLRRVLHAMPSLFQELSKREVYLLSHAANDHSLTIVVDEVEADCLVRALHQELVCCDLGVPDAATKSMLR